jgi:hypothetical protein
MSNARHQVRSEALDARKTWVLSARGPVCTRRPDTRRLRGNRRRAVRSHSGTIRAARESSSGREIVFWHHAGWLLWIK